MKEKSNIIRIGEKVHEMVERKQELRGLSALELRQFAKLLLLRKYEGVRASVLVESIVDIEFKTNARGEPANHCYTCGQTSTKRVDHETWGCAYCSDYAVEVKSS